jgi:eukaryotic-like serine/threonine-protein kinase
MKKNLPASASLEGFTLPTGWKVTRALERTEDTTGGQFSNAYVILKDGTEGFLKAFDFSDAFTASNVLEALNQLTTAYIYERDLLLHCGTLRLKKVVVAIEHGEFQVPDYESMSGRVFYLIFHLADGDVRRQISKADRFDPAWCASALRDVTIAMQQIHRQMIAHQDVKPSNVLVFRGDFKLADFGRASRKGHPAIHDAYDVAGDLTYAPPEQLYGYRHVEFSNRRFGCDLYMLGNLASFLFTGVNVTAQLFTHLAPQFHHKQWSQGYTDVLPYLQQAFGSVLTDIRGSLAFPHALEVEGLIRELCNPDLSRRGHPKGIGRYDQYSLERYVSRLDILSKKISMETKTMKRAG